MATCVLCLFRTLSRAQSLTLPRFGPTSPTRMIDLLYALLAAARSSLKPQHWLALKNLALRQQPAILKRKTRRPKLNDTGRVFWVALSQRTAGLSCAHCVGVERMPRSTGACPAFTNAHEVSTRRNHPPLASSTATSVGGPPLPFSRACKANSRTLAISSSE